MRILFSVPRYHPNHDGMVAGLLAAGHEVAFLVREVHPAERHRVPVTRLPETPDDRAPVAFLRRVLRASRPDVVVARNTDAVSDALYLLCRLRRIPFLLYVQAPDGYETMKPGRRLRLALGLWPRHTVNSACPAPKAEVPGKTYDFLPFPVELGPEKTDWPAAAPIRVLTVGKLDQERKNHVPVVRALAPLLRDGRIRLTILGLREPEVTPVFRALLDEIDRQGVAGQVRILENLPYDAARDLYAAHDLFLLASSNERAAISPAEAMASGVAAVCGSDNGTTYFVREGETGFVFPDRDFTAMAALVARLAAEPSELERMGRAARRMIAENYAPAAYARRFEAVVARRFGPIRRSDR